MSASAKPKKGAAGLAIAVKVIILLLAFSLIGIVVYSTVSGGANGSQEFKAKLYTVEEMDIPDHLLSDRLFGLYFYDPDGVHYTRSTEDLSNINFDPNKPTAIFIHGMQMNNGYNSVDEIYNPIGWLDAGYNFGVFLWSQIADCGTPGNGKSHIWYGNSEFYYPDPVNKNAKGQPVRLEESVDRLKYPTAMVFGTYYFDLMNRVGDYKGSSITIAGHSLGANTNIAIGSYFFTLYDQGTITKQYLPDRFVYLDAYMDAFTETETIVPWLNAPIGQGGVIQKGVEVAQKATSLGISTEYLKSCKGVSLLGNGSAYGGTPGTCENYFSKMYFIDMQDKSGGGFAENHVASMAYFLRSMTAEKNVVCNYSVDDEKFPDCYDPVEEEYVYDKDTIIEYGLIGWSSTTPLSVTYARNGKSCVMPHLNDTQQRSDNVDCPVIAGFVFTDENNNGIYDERVKNRVAGVTVALYRGNTKVTEVTTDEAGAYRFEVGSAYAGKTYTIKATLPDGKTFTKKVSSSPSACDSITRAFMTNNVNASGESEEITFVDKIQIKIVNVGVRPDEE